MALANYKAERRAHGEGEAQFFVQGLSLAPLTTLIQLHLKDIESLWKLCSEIMNGNVEFSEDDLALLASALAQQAPGLVANMIALASGESDNPTAIEAAAQLPLGTQIAVLYDILDLTFTEIGSVKKVFALLKAKLATQKMLKPSLKTAQ